jgi:ribosomal protein S1
MKLSGTVKKIELFGAFVDVGVGRDGLLHISALSPKRVNKVEEVVKEGDQVTVWVRKVDPKAGRIDLTLMEPLALDWDEIKVNQTLKGKVVKIEKFGAFVEIGAERPGLIHISELAGHRVDEVTEIVKLGDEVEVKVLAVDPRKKQIKLSMKAMEMAEKSREEREEPDSPPMTSMEFALRQAMSLQAAKRRAAGRKLRRQRGRQEQEDILSRTLAHKRK